MNIKRITISLLLSVALIISFVPGAAFAASENEAGTDPGTDQTAIGSEAITESAETDVDIADNDELLMEYMKHLVSDETGNSFEKNEGKSRLRAKGISKRRNTLGELDVKIYDSLLEQINTIIEPSEEEGPISTSLVVPLSSLFGELEKANVEMTVQYDTGTEEVIHMTHKLPAESFGKIVDEEGDLRIAYDDIISALLADQPYAMYWYDKVKSTTIRTGAYYTYDDYVYFDSTPGVTFAFTAAKEYSYTDEEQTNSISAAKVKAAYDAAQTASAIINDNADKTDVEKLYAYKKVICDAVDYNEEAAKDESMPYGNPWQMIWVFDTIADGEGNLVWLDETKVVCEGYSKAFQFLCDGSSFSSSKVECDTVTGLMNGGSGAGKHMWNILRMDDGKNYIADITNSDEGSAGENGEVFLKGFKSGSVSDGYSYDASSVSGTIDYTYSDDTCKLFSVSELTMSASDYSENEGDEPDTSTVRETDVASAAEGNVLVYVEGRFVYLPKKTILDRINELRWEACREGVWDPRDASKQRRLTETDYVPIKWSSDLEWIAQTRAAEAAVYENHTRTNGITWKNLYHNEIRSYGEILAWNSGADILGGINQWYEEKSDWVGQTGETTGHYTQMIDPDNKYIGIGAFDPGNGNRGAIAGEFNKYFVSDVDETQHAQYSGKVLQTMEVQSDKLTVSAASPVTIHIGAEKELTLDKYVTYDETRTNVKLIDEVQWSSTEQDVVSVDNEGKASALSTGNAVVKAAVNGSEYTFAVTVEDHVWDSGTVTKEPSCTGTGLKKFSCAKCDEEKTEAIPVVAHSLTPHEAKEATCSETGNSKYWSCSVCDKLFSDSEGETETTLDEVTLAIDLNAHSYGDWTKLNDEQHQKVCANDHKHVLKENHSWNDGEITKTATCTEKGEKTYTCTACGETKTEEIEALGHEWEFVDFTWTGDSDSCSAAANYKCKNDESHTDTVEAVVEKISETDSTCSSKGSVTYQASVTAENIMDKAAHEDIESYDKALASHTLTPHEATEPTYSSSGNIEYWSCDVCGKYFSDAEGKTVISENSWVIDPKDPQEDLERLSGLAEAAKTAAAEAESKAGLAKDAVAALETAAAAAKDAADKASKSLDAGDIADAKAKAKAAEAAQTAAAAAISEAETAKGIADAAISAAENAISSARGEGLSGTEAIEEKVEAAQSQTAEAGKDIGAAKTEKAAQDSVVKEAAETADKAESDKKTADQKAADEIAAQKEAEIAAAKKAEAERLEWEGTVSSAIPAVKGMKVKAAKKKVTVSWKKLDKKKIKKFNKVEIQVCTDKSFRKDNTKRVEVKNSKKTATVKGLAKKKTYYVRVRDVKGNGASKQVSKWSKAKKIKTK